MTVFPPDMTQKQIAAYNDARARFETHVFPQNMTLEQAKFYEEAIDHHESGMIAYVHLFEDTNHLKLISFADIYNTSHREGAPARIEWYENRQKCSVGYHWKGGQHRKDGPSFHSWHPNGQPYRIYYHVKNKTKRNPIFGPAIEHFDEGGNSIKRRYYWQNREWTGKELMRILYPDMQEDGLGRVFI